MSAISKLGKFGMASAVFASVLSFSAAAGAGTASAARACDAPAGWQCIAVRNTTSDVHSWRNPSWNNQCLPNSAPGTKRYYQSFTNADTPKLLAFSDANCGNAISNNRSRTYDKDEGNFVVIVY